MSRKLLFAFFLSVVALVWVVMMILVVQRDVSVDTTAAEEIPHPVEGDSSEWMSIYLSGNKIGHIVSLTTRTETGLESVESSYMRFGLSGTGQDMKTFVRAQADIDYRMRSFSFEIRSRHQSLKASGEVKDGSLEVILNSGGEIQNLSFALPEDAYMPFSVVPLIEKKGLNKGDSISITVFDPTVLQPSSMWIKHEGLERIEHSGRTVEVIHLTTTFLGAKMDMWIDLKGKSLRQEGPMGLLIVAEPRETAESFPHEERPVELLTLFSIPCDREISRPRSVTHMRVEMSGVELDSTSLSNNRQTVRSISPFLVEVSAVNPGMQDETDTSRTLQHYLKPEPLLQVKHPRIAATADSIVDELTDPWAKARAIVEWVHETLEKSPTVSLPSALDVLESRQGDCNEHAVLVAALSRAASIPATIASGIVYLDGSFYYHAWNRVYVGEWVDMDATFGQEVADATHLLLAEGGMENQASMANIIGGLRIKLLQYR
jgi:hypothetical protein